MLLNSSAGPVPGPCASRMIVPSSIFQSTSPSISLSSPAAASAAIHPRRSPKAVGFVRVHRHPFEKRAGGSPGRPLHGLDDLRIRRAPAQIARKIMPDLVLVGIRILLEQLPCHQDEARRAEAALEGAALDKGLLHGVEPALGDARSSPPPRRPRTRRGTGNPRRPSRSRAPCSSRTAPARSSPARWSGQSGRAAARRGFRAWRPARTLPRRSA